MPRILIIGDSHVENYYRIIATELQGEAYCCKLTTSKSLGDPVLIDEIELILKQYDFDVIAFNNGLHGKAYTEEQYGSYIPILYGVFQKMSNAKIIWINTTALRNKKDINVFDDFNIRIIERNKLVEDFARSKNIPVIDMYSLSVDNPEYYKKDGCHFNKEGVIEEGLLLTNEIRRITINK
ncbi:SGNH/GDSL hydrolase family protein [Bacteroidota bacterium]